MKPWEETWRLSGAFMYSGDALMGNDCVKEAAEYFAKGCGTYLRTFRPALEAIVEELERLSRGRKSRPDFFYDACSLLANKLRDGIAEAKKLEAKP